MYAILSGCPGDASNCIRSDRLQCIVIGLVQRLLDVRGAGNTVSALDDELNRRVYGLFGVSPEKVGIIDGGKG